MATVDVRLPALAWSEPIVDPNTGRPSPYFQRFWQNITVKAAIGSGAAVDISGKVDKLTSIGWGTPTGTADTTTFATYNSPAISNPPTQAQVQAISDHLQVLSQHMKAVIEGAKTAQLFGS